MLLKKNPNKPRLLLDSHDRPSSSSTHLLSITSDSRFLAIHIQDLSLSLPPTLPHPFIRVSTDKIRNRVEGESTHTGCILRKPCWGVFNTSPTGPVYAATEKINKNRTGGATQAACTSCKYMHVRTMVYTSVPSLSPCPVSPLSASVYCVCVSVHARCMRSPLPTLQLWYECC